jgi:hypothetical protein
MGLAFQVIFRVKHHSEVFQLRNAMSFNAFKFVYFSLDLHFIIHYLGANGSRLNPSYFGVRAQKAHSSKPAQANSS